LHAPAPGRDDQSLAERMRVPRRARARLEGDESGADARRLERREQGIDANRAGETFRRSNRGRLRSGMYDIH
jgi:hypothetical protein